MTNLEKFQMYLKDLESPRHYITWNYYFAVASTLGRRVWIGDFDYKPIFPNMYLIFVGDPATGKSLPATSTKYLLKSLKGSRVIYKQGVERPSRPMSLVNVSMDSGSLERLVDQMAKSTETIVREYEDEEKKLPIAYAHTSVTFILDEEIALLFRKNTNDLVQFITAGYNCGEYKRMTHSHKEEYIKNMCINFSGCCTPEWIATNITEALVAEGFTSRVIFVWGEETGKRSTLLEYNEAQRAAMHSVRDHLLKLTQLKGQIVFNKQDTPEAWEFFDDWVQRGYKEVLNKDPKLKHYYSRKKIHLYKLATAMHFGEKTSMQLDREDFENALLFLNKCELDMHKALASAVKNPLQVLADKIKEYVKKSHGLQECEIYLFMYNMGRESEIEEAIRFLAKTNQIYEKVENNKKVWKLNEQELGL